MTGTINGTISIWRNGLISKSIKCNGKEPLIKVVDQDIIVASKNGKLLVLDTTLNVTKQYKTINDSPRCLSATGKFIATGTYGGEVIFFDRKRLLLDKLLDKFYNRNGSTEPRVRIKLRKQILNHF